AGPYFSYTPGGQLVFEFTGLTLDGGQLTSESLIDRDSILSGLSEIDFRPYWSDKDGISFRFPSTMKVDSCGIEGKIYFNALCGSDRPMPLWISFKKG